MQKLSVFISTTHHYLCLSKLGMTGLL